jgi:hypothetical protein
MASAETVFFQIATAPDMLGALINQRLHLTVKPLAWWWELFGRLGYAVTWTRETADYAILVVTSTAQTEEKA